MLNNVNPLISNNAAIGLLVHSVYRMMARIFVYLFKFRTMLGVDTICKLLTSYINKNQPNLYLSGYPLQYLCEFNVHIDKISHFGTSRCIHLLTLWVVCVSPF